MHLLHARDVKDKVREYYREIKKFKKEKEEREAMIMAQLAAYYDGATGEKQKFIMEQAQKQLDLIE